MAHAERMGDAGTGCICEQMSETRDAESFTDELSSVLREFLKMQFELAAPKQTSGELIATIEQRRLVPNELTQRFSDVFAATDLAKFAGVQLSSAELLDLIDQSEQLVEATVTAIASDQLTAEAA